MHILNLSYSDTNGGAARAAYRIHQALRDSEINSNMLVEKSSTGDWSVYGPMSKKDKAITQLRTQIGAQIAKLQKTNNPIIHSLQILPSRLVKKINSSDAELINLHWIQNEMISIKDISKISKPIVWTLHDMWGFCGAEHLALDNRWEIGYRKSNRPNYESGLDLNRWTWERKIKHWKPMHIVTPSQWMADCAKRSYIMKNWPITVIPNPIDTTNWKPVDKIIARNLFNLPTDVPLILFGAMGGARDYHKGYDLLVDALNNLRDIPHLKNLEILVFGQLAPREKIDLGFRIHYMGHIHDDLTLKILYNAADILAIPSRQDNLPNTGVEALACGTPVIAFDTCGLPDIVDHRSTGYLAKAFNTEDFAHGINWLLSDSNRLSSLRTNSRNYAVSKFSFPVVADKYKSVYKEVLNIS